MLLLLCLTANAETPKKTVITRADELPRRSVKLEGTALQLLDDQKQLDKLAADLTRNLETDLAAYDIRDGATLKGYYSILHILHMRAGRYDQALALLPKMREAESKPGLRHMTGLFAQAYVDALRTTKDTASPAFKAAFESSYAALLAKLPWNEVQEHVEEQKGQLAMMTSEMLLGGMQSGFQQLLDNTKGVVPEGAVAGLLSTKYMLTHRLPLRDESVRALGRFRDANHKEDTAADIWAERNVSLAEASNLKPVVVGVWDSGVDANALPATNRFVNAKETFDGKDNDGNGYVDDVHGIGYDLAAGKKSPGTLDNPAGKIKSDVKRLQRLTKGYIDLQASIQSPEAAELQKTITSLQRDQVQEFSQELAFYTNYFHGTHVAGIVADGNPAAKILGARMTASNAPIPPAPTMEMTRFTAQMYRDTVDYFKTHGARVVNMSWRYNAASIEGALTANGVGGSEAERKALARKMFDIEKAALRDAIAGAPNILFVCGSGNENNSADFSEYIPASLNLPNLVTVGAVDHAGRKTSFTTEGASVDFYANGFEIESYVPGGDRIRMSGTSMSSPQVANLAAKLLALDPSLTPAQLLALIRKGADGQRLIDPARTLQLARK